jgi:drug/metabolite transporter (DMT)-like permease
MAWFFIALIAPILYASANHIDKYLISKYLHNVGVGSLIIFSALFSVFAIPIILLINPNVLDLSLWQAVILSLAGVLLVFSVFFYLYALSEDEATFVVPFYQTIPIFAFILAYFILGEILTKNQMIWSLVILLGATILSFDFKDQKIRFKKKVVILMILSSFFYALSDVIYKMVAIERGFWISIFWTMVGKVLIGIIFLIVVRRYREQFFNVIKEARAKIIGLNSLNETLVIFADVTAQYALLLAPVALVLLVGSFQPLFVFLIGIFLTVFFPKISEESITPKILTQKIIGLILTVLGGFMLVT